MKSNHLLFNGFSLKGRVLVCLAFLGYVFAGAPLAPELFRLSEVPESSSDDEALYDFFDEGSQTESIIPTNPFELMDRIRRSTAMDNATSPSDAIDDAIRSFEDGIDD